jgi:uncharacterized protein YajQ (UPF0234 family)
MPSFDIVSKVPMNEVDNAILQAQKEIGSRFDFKDTGTELEKSEDGMVIRSSSEGRLEAGRKVLEEKLIKRGVSIRSLDAQKVEPAAKGTYRQLVKLQQGISIEKAREIVKFLKETKIKVQAAIQADQIRVSGKKRDDLQEAIAALKKNDFKLDLQYSNFRE